MQASVKQALHPAVSRAGLESSVRQSVGLKLTLRVRMPGPPPDQLTAGDPIVESEADDSFADGAVRPDGCCCAQRTGSRSVELPNRAQQTPAPERQRARTRRHTPLPLSMNAASVSAGARRPLLAEAATSSERLLPRSGGQRRRPGHDGSRRNPAVRRGWRRQARSWPPAPARASRAQRRLAFSAHGQQACRTNRWITGRLRAVRTGRAPPTASVSVGKESEGVSASAGRLRGGARQ